MKSLDPKFISALLIDLVIITLTLFTFDTIMGSNSMPYIFYILGIYAVIHIAFEMIGIG